MGTGQNEESHEQRSRSTNPPGTAGATQRLLDKGKWVGRHNADRVSHTLSDLPIKAPRTLAKTKTRRKRSMIAART
ncbi:hypothetical protein AA103193_2802 [Tanticharoenia sakaeratensis NBRC 103193]|nr:hypothetical protein AA103193_2802 [Tanticharoenia sakaeratensis NBRC 103193]